MTDEDYQNLISNDNTSDSISNDAVVLDTSFHSMDSSLCHYHGDDSERTSLTDDFINMDSFYPAPPLQDLYRYHIFFSHSPSDHAWVEEIVHKLEDCPYYYKCYYNNKDRYQTNISIIQSTLCAAMLSERVVIVLSRNYVCSTWFEFQEILKNLTTPSLYQQRMVVILLEDCDIPETLQTVGYLDIRQKDFFQLLTRLLRSNRLPRSSDSISSDMSSVLSTRANLTNGQLLATITGKIKGRWRATLVFDCDEDIPTPLSCHGINVSYDEYADIINMMMEDSSIQSHLSWPFTMKPVLVILILFLLWIIAFILVIILLIDAPKSSALPVRLTVFLFPLALLMAGYAIRRIQKQLCAKIDVQMLKKCVHLNQMLNQLDRPVLLTACHKRGHTFLIYFVYFNISDCVLKLNMFLNNLGNESKDRLLTLIEFYTLDTLYLPQGSLAEKLVVMMGGSYTLQLVYRLLLKPPQEQHVCGHLCLCQFTEEFISYFLQSVEGQRDDILLRSIFVSYLNISLTRSSIQLLMKLLKT